MKIIFWMKQKAYKPKARITCIKARSLNILCIEQNTQMCQERVILWIIAASWICSSSVSSLA